MGEPNTSIKERNELFMSKELIPALIKWPGQIPVGQLIVFFHSANGLGLTWGKSEDEAEKRNYKYLKTIYPSFDDAYLQAFICGSFKPPHFIHPFEYFHTSTGNQDPDVLSEFFQTIDALTSMHGKKPKMLSETFLSFVYMYFLVIHPFIDGNGRVSRNLLDYYNLKLGFNLPSTWNATKPKFSENIFHKEAFKILLSEELGLTKCEFSKIPSFEEVLNIQIEKKMELARLKEKLIYNFRYIRSTSFISSKAIEILANGIIAGVDKSS